MNMPPPVSPVVRMPGVAPPLSGIAPSACDFTCLANCAPECFDKIKQCGSDPTCYIKHCGWSSVKCLATCCLK